MEKSDLSNDELEVLLEVAREEQDWYKRYVGDNKPSLKIATRIAQIKAELVNRGYKFLTM